MKNRPAKLFFFVLTITGLLLQGMGSPVAVRAADFRIGAVTTNVNIRKTPSLQGDIVAGLQQGAPVKVYGEKDGWYRISSKKNYILFKGWVYKRYVAIAADASESLQSSAPGPEPPSAAQPETPLPAPAEKPGLPEPAAAAPAPAPDEPAAALKTAKPVVKIARPARTAPVAPPAVENPLVTAGSSKKPSEALRLVLSLSPLVLAVIALFIAVRAYRTARSPGPELEPVNLPPQKKGIADDMSRAEEIPASPPQGPPVNEKRRAPRTNRLIEIDFAVGGKFYRGFVNNLSKAGVYIDTPVSFKIGQEITVSCPAIDTGGQIKRSGLIVRKTELGIAVHFQQNDTA